MKKLAALAALVLVLIVTAPDATVAQDGDPIATVSRIRGTAAVVRAAGPRPLEAGAVLFVADRVATGTNTRLEFEMIDGSVVTLGDNSELIIDDFLFDAEAGRGRAALRLVDGVFRAVTGRITDLAQAEFTVTTPVATLGIRGTTAWGQQSAELLQAAMLEGTSVTVTNAAGSVTITEPNFVTRVTDANVAPTTPVALTAAELQAAIATVSF